VPGGFRKTMCNSDATSEQLFNTAARGLTEICENFKASKLKKKLLIKYKIRRRSIGAY
jgi:hypothetical protein